MDEAKSRVNYDENDEEDEFPSEGKLWYKIVKTLKTWANWYGQI